MKPFKTKNGITVKQLKKIVKLLPEVNESTGDDYEVWVDGTGCERGLSNVCKEIWQLNKGDIIFLI